MTMSSLADAVTVRSGYSRNFLGRGFLSALQFFRPRDGWLSMTLLALNLDPAKRGLENSFRAACRS